MPNHPNGVITFYTIYLQYNDDADSTSSFIVSANATTFTVSNLQPYTLVRIKISANTSRGEGPLSAAVDIRTAQASKFFLYCHDAIYMR